MGTDSSTIDLSSGVSAEQLAVAEREANRVVWQDRPVSIRFATQEEAAQLPLRKPPKKAGTIRLIDIKEWDLSACGGTHVAATGEVGVIAISGWEKFKGGTRVEFVCGGRALARFRSLRDISLEASRVLSTSVADIPSGIERLLDDAKERRRSMAAMQTELTGYRASALAAGAEPMPRGRLVLQAVDGDAQALKALASAITSQPQFAAVLVSTSSPALVVVARSADVDLRANDTLAALIAKFGGRGGGKPDLAQAGGLTGTAADILAEAARHFRI